MQALLDPSPRLTGATLGIPYALAPYTDEAPRFVPQPEANMYLSDVPLSVHNDLRSLLIQNCRDLLGGHALGVSLHEYAGMLRARLMERDPVPLRALGRTLIRWHNADRLQPKGGPLDDAVRVFRFVPFADIAARRPQNEPNLDVYLKAAGYFGPKLTVPELPQALEELPVPHDALAFLALYPPVATAAESDTPHSRLINELGGTKPKVIALAAALGRRAVVRRRRGSSYQEGEYYTADDAAVISTEYRRRLRGQHS